MIGLFGSNGERLGTIDAMSGFLAVDTSGTLYVANTGNGPVNYITKFDPPYTKKSAIIRLGKNQAAFGVAVDERTGMLAVISRSFIGGDEPELISFYPHNMSTPCRVISSNHRLPAIGSEAAFDADGNLFFGALSASEGIVVASVSGGCNAGPLSILSFSKPIYPYGYMTFNKTNNFVIQSFVDDKPGPIYTYAHPQHNVFAAPLATTVPESSSGGTLEFDALTGDGLHLWAGDYSGTIVSLYDYPKGGLPTMTIPHVTLPESAAVLPPLIP